jgi:hypothetical protein
MKSDIRISFPKKVKRVIGEIEISRFLLKDKRYSLGKRVMLMEFLQALRKKGKQ